MKHVMVMSCSMLMVLLCLILPQPVTSVQWAAFVGGRYFAVEEQTPHQMPLNALSQYVGTLSPLGQGVFSSGTVARMVRNASTIIIGGSFQWARCDPRSCEHGMGLTDERVLRNVAMFDFDTAQWSGIGAGCAGYVNDVAVHGANVFIGGTLTYVNLILFFALF
jgi:hypothetical protein